MSFELEFHRSDRTQIYKIVVHTDNPSQDPTTIPSADPTTIPLADPTALPSADPTTIPSADPTMFPSADLTSIPSADPTSIPTYVPTEDCVESAQYNCAWYNECLKFKYQCGQWGYPTSATQFCEGLNSIIDEDMSSDGKLWIKSFLQCHQNAMKPFASDTADISASCSLLGSFGRARENDCMLNADLRALFCYLPSADQKRINAIKNVDAITKCTSNLNENIEFFQLVMDNDQNKPIFDIGVDFVKVGLLTLNAAFCLPPFSYYSWYSLPSSACKRSSSMLLIYMRK